MKGSAEGNDDAHGVLTGAISIQVARALEAVEEGKAAREGRDVAHSVHEARRAIKRARALLRLATPHLSNTQTACTLRDASRALAWLRDADVLVLTAEDIRDGSESSELDLVPPPLLESLEQDRERRFTEAGSAEGPLQAACELLKSVVVEVHDLHSPETSAGSKPTAPGGMEVPSSSRRESLWLGLGASYAAVQARSDPAEEERQAEGEVPAREERPTQEEGQADERSHKLRKRVKDLRYQLEFLDTGHPKLGRLVRDLHHLTDLLGDRNDLAMLTELGATTDVVREIDRSALRAHIERKKRALGSEAAALSARLFEEDADSFVRRVAAWVTKS